MGVGLVMENLIGTILMAGRLKQVLVQYRLFFTDSRLIAIETGKLPAHMWMTGMAGGIAQGMENAKIINQWTDVVIDANSNHRPVVSYKETISDELLGLQSISILYEKVKTVEIRKVTRDNVDPNKLEYSISISMGLLSSESFLIPGIGLEETKALLAKTPLAAKLKQ
jgi:hypothetical protein